MSEVCPRCGSSDLMLKDLDAGKSPFSQILKCNRCGSEMLIPRREEATKTEKMSEQLNTEEPTKRVWRVLVE